MPDYFRYQRASQATVRALAPAADRLITDTLALLASVLVVLGILGLILL
ncbi:MAG: hypothetical protein ACI80V_002507 [Rhodothermales bacterium]|jgi:hypothetical protein